MRPAWEAGTAWQTLPWSLRREHGPANTSLSDAGLDWGGVLLVPTPPRLRYCDLSLRQSLETDAPALLLWFSKVHQHLPLKPLTSPWDSNSMAGTRTPWLLLGSGSPVLGAPPRDSPSCQACWTPSDTLARCRWEMGLYIQKGQESASSGPGTLRHTHA